MTAPEHTALRERLYNATLIGERRHHGAVMVIRVLPDHPIPIPSPGQWLELGLGVWEPVMEGAEAGTPKRMPPDGLVRRAYSLSSPIISDAGDRLLELEELTTQGYEFFLSLVVPPAERAGRVPNLTGRLFELKEGDRLFMSTEPRGNYKLDAVKEDDNLLFLATGTGEAPHNHMIWELLRRGHQGHIASVVSVRHPEDLAYHDVHERLTELFPNYRYHALATREDPEEHRRLQDYLADGTITEWAGFELEPEDTQVFLCGNPGMIGPPRVLSGQRLYPDAVGLVELLETDYGFSADLNLSPLNVHYERYW